MSAPSIMSLTLDSGDVMDFPPTIIVYGKPGIGKSTEMAKCFPNCLYVTSSPTVLRPLASWISQNPEEAAKRGIRMPAARKTVLATQPGAPTNWQLLTAIVQLFVQSALNGTNPYDGIIFDEWSEFASRIQEDMLKSGQFTAKSGNLDKFKAMDALVDFHRNLFMLPRLTGKVLGLICHEREPAYHGDDSPTDKRGTLKYAGGPAVPMGSLVRKIAADADVVIQMVIEDPQKNPMAALGGESAPQVGKRKFLTETSELWDRKFRAFGVKSTQDLAEMDLRTMLLNAGYKL